MTLEDKIGIIFWKHLETCGVDTSKIPYKGWPIADVKKALEECPLRVAENNLIQEVDKFMQGGATNEAEYLGFRLFGHRLLGINAAHDKLLAVRPAD